MIDYFGCLMTIQLQEIQTVQKEIVYMYMLIVCFAIDKSHACIVGDMVVKTVPSDVNSHTSSHYAMDVSIETNLVCADEEIVFLMYMYYR